MKAEAEVQLLQRCVRGEEAAWNRLFDEYYEDVFRFFLRQNLDFTPEDAEVLCREVFLAAIQNIASYQSRGGLGLWLLRIAMNRGRARIAKNRRARQAEAPPSAPPLPESRSRHRRSAAPPPPPPPPATPEEAFQLLRGALDRLGGPCRDLIELHYFGDVSVPVLALEFEMSLRSQRTRLRKCLKRLEELAPSLTEQIAQQQAREPEEEEDALSAEPRKSSRHHPVLDRYLREYTEERDAGGSEKASMPDDQRAGLLKIVQEGIPRRRRRRRRTEYEDELEEKRLRKKRGAASPSGKAGVFRAVGGLALKLLAVVTVMAVLAVVIFWWLDRMSVRQAEEASTRSRKAFTNRNIAPDASLGVFASLEDLTPRTNAPAGADSPAEPASVTEPTAAEPPPPAASGEDIPPKEYVARLAALAAQVPPDRGGARVEFDPPPPEARLRKRVPAPDAPDMFRRVRIVQNIKGIEVTDRWDGSFFPVQASVVPMAKINEAARAQALELPGVTPATPSVLVLTGKGASFTLGQDIQVRLELVLRKVPDGVAIILRERDAKEAFKLWLEHSHLYGEATLENGAKVLFEGVPVKR